MRQELQTRMDSFVQDLQGQYGIFDAVINLTENALNTTLERSADLTYMAELDGMSVMVILNEALAGGSVVVACNIEGPIGMGSARIATMTITSSGTTQETIGNINSVQAHDTIAALFSNIFRYVNRNVNGVTSNQEGEEDAEDSNEVDTP